MAWKNIESIEQWQSILKSSYQSKQIVFKHSSTCSISAVIKARLDNRANIQDLHINYVKEYRDVSNKISDDMGIVHESPQLLIIDKGICQLDRSHFDIDASLIS